MGTRSCRVGVHGRGAARTRNCAFLDRLAGPWAESDAIQALRDGDIEAFAALHYGNRQAARRASAVRGLRATFEGLSPMG